MAPVTTSKHVTDPHGANQNNTGMENVCMCMAWGGANRNEGTGQQGVPGMKRKAVSKGKRTLVEISTKAETPVSCPRPRPRGAEGEGQTRGQRTEGKGGLHIKAKDFSIFSMFNGFLHLYTKLIKLF